MDVALEGLRMALRSRKARPARIAEYAQKLRIWSVMRPYLESMAAGEKDHKPSVSHVATRFVRFGPKALTLGSRLTL